jgi:NTP pyrophosphatase (non-canonical NTP hydrolase)
MKTLNDLTSAIVSFRDVRDWKQFHSLKEMVLSLMLESAEVAELLQWKRDDELVPLPPELKQDLSRELADVLHWVLLIAHDHEIDLEVACDLKVKENEAKYPIELARGNRTKYNKLKS